MSRLDIYNISHVRKVVWKLITVIFFSFLILRMFFKNISSLISCFLPRNTIILKKIGGASNLSGKVKTGFMKHFDFNLHGSLSKCLM